MNRGRKNRHRKARLRAREQEASYAAFIARCYRECHCDEYLRPCPGVMYGALCDDMRTGFDDGDWEDDIFFDGSEDDDEAGYEVGW